MAAVRANRERRNESKKERTRTRNALNERRKLVTVGSTFLVTRRPKTELAYTNSGPEGKHYSHLIIRREKELTVIGDEWKWG